MSATMEVFLSPAAVAKSRRINTAKVLGWIHSGQLRALNYASRPNGVPRWRIDPADLAAFDESRASNREAD